LISHHRIRSSRTASSSAPSQRAPHSVGRKHSCRCRRPHAYAPDLVALCVAAPFPGFTGLLLLLRGVNEVKESKSSSPGSRRLPFTSSPVHVASSRRVDPPRRPAAGRVRQGTGPAANRAVPNRACFAKAPKLGLLSVLAAPGCLGLVGQAPAAGA
jgi:hypothetical protein